MDRAGAQEVLLRRSSLRSCGRSPADGTSTAKSSFGSRTATTATRASAPPTKRSSPTFVRNEVQSYRQLPLNLYQVQTKSATRSGPRFGLMRGSRVYYEGRLLFDVDDAGAEESYRKMHEAYTRIFERCGLEFVPVEADTGAIGGSFSTSSWSSRIRGGFDRGVPRVRVWGERGEAK